MATTIDLGFKTPDYSAERIGAPSNSEKEMPTKTAYPSLTIAGNKALARALKPGQKITALVTFCVCDVAIRDRKGEKESDIPDPYSGTRVEMEAESMTFESLKIEEEPEMDGASAFQKFMQKKSGKDQDDD